MRRWASSRVSVSEKEECMFKADGQCTLNRGDMSSSSMAMWDRFGSRDKVRICWRMMAFRVFRRLKRMVMAVNCWMREDG